MNRSNGASQQQAAAPRRQRNYLYCKVCESKDGWNSWIYQDRVLKDATLACAFCSTPWTRSLSVRSVLSTPHTSACSGSAPNEARVYLERTVASGGQQQAAAAKALLDSMDAEKTAEQTSAVCVTAGQVVRAAEVKRERARKALIKALDKEKRIAAELEEQKSEVKRLTVLCQQAAEEEREAIRKAAEPTARASDPPLSSTCLSDSIQRELEQIVKADASNVSDSDRKEIDEQYKSIESHLQAESAKLLAQFTEKKAELEELVSRAHGKRRKKDAEENVEVGAQPVAPGSAASASKDGDVDMDGVGKSAEEKLDEAASDTAKLADKLIAEGFSKQCG